jgi:membrane-bound lytic murein transglycosylase F
MLATCSPRVDTLDQVRAGGSLRVAMMNSPTTYYIGPSGPTGFEYELARELADKLGVKLDVVIAPSASAALEMVERGQAHFAAAGLGVSPSHAPRLRYSTPLLKVVPQLVYRSDGHRPASLDDLRGELVVTAGSSHAELLAQQKTRHPGLRWSETDQFEPEELLAQVAEGSIDYAVINSDLVSINQRYYPELRVAFPIAEQQDVAWAFARYADDSLLQAANALLSKLGDVELARLRDRYFGHVERIDYLGAVALATHVETRLPRYRPIFEEAARQYGVDWRLLAAMGYQESHWSASAVSDTGVRGIMMLTQSTARFLEVDDREDPRQSIMGGARYFRRLLDQLPPEIEEPDRSWLALAAYNMGLGHLRDAQELTRQRGGDPNHWLDVRNNLPLLTQSRWYSKTRNGYARGHQAMHFVENIRTYYDMLVWKTGGHAAPDTPELQQAGNDPPAIESPGEDDLLHITTPVL